MYEYICNEKYNLHVKVFLLLHCLSCIRVYSIYFLYLLLLLKSKHITLQDLFIILNGIH